MGRLLVFLGIIGIGFGATEMDWTNLSVKISTTVPPSQKNVPKEELFSQFLKTFKELYFDAHQTVGEYLESHPIVAAKLQNTFFLPKRVGEKYLSDGSLQLQYEIMLQGGILSSIIPKTGGGKPLTVLLCPLCKRPWPKDMPVPPGVHLIPKEEEYPIPYTGVLVDARGLNLNKALFPKIVNEDNQEVYGLGFVLRPYAIQRGIVSYVHSSLEAYKNERLGTNPLRVVALRVTGKNKTDLVLPNSDAEKLHNSSQNLKLLKECRVVILVD